MEINFAIKGHIGSLSVNPKGWTKEVNLVSWNGRNTKYDIREWEPGHQRMGRGITLTGEEARKLYELLKVVFA